MKQGREKKRMLNHANAQLNERIFLTVFSRLPCVVLFFSCKYLIDERGRKRRVRKNRHKPGIFFISIRTVYFPHVYNHVYKYAIRVGNVGNTACQSLNVIANVYWFACVCQKPNKNKTT